MALPIARSPVDDLKKLLAWPSIASKNWVYRQYDHQVRDGSVVLPGSDAAVIRIKTDSLPVMSAELAAKVGDADSFREIHRHDGGLQRRLRLSGSLRRRARRRWPKPAATWPARGAVPLGATDNLNMPNPLKPELFWQIKESVRGLADGCRLSTRPSPAAIARFTIKVPPARLTPRPPLPSSASSKNRNTSPRNGSRTKATPSSCSANRWMQADPLLGPGRQRVFAGHSRPKKRLAAALRFGNRQDPAHHAARPDSKRPGEERA